MASQILEDQCIQSKNSKEISIITSFAMPSELRQMETSDKKMGREDVKKLNTEWIKEMTTSDATIAEKVSFFWRDHFIATKRLSYNLRIVQ